METQKLCALSRLAFKNNIILKNRIVVPPMASGTADAVGFVTKATLAHYQRLSESNAGLIFVEYTYVHSTGKSEPQQLAADQDEQIEGLSNLSAVIKESGAVAGLQLTHAGGKSSQQLTQGQLMGPSGIRVPIKGDELEIPRAMDLEDMNLWKDSFVQAAVRASKAGFQMIELHAAHGYGLNQWLSPITNQRTDLYGNDNQGRSRILLEIIEEIKKEIPELLISVRMPGQDFFEGGLTPEDSIEIAKALENSGVNIIHVSSGIGGWRRPGHRNGEGYLVEEAGQIQKQVSIPVIGVGGITTADYINRSLKDNLFSLAAVGRSILTNPQEWAKQNLFLQNCKPLNALKMNSFV